MNVRFLAELSKSGHSASHPVTVVPIWICMFGRYPLHYRH